MRSRRRSVLEKEIKALMELSADPQADNDVKIRLHWSAQTLRWVLRQMDLSPSVAAKEFFGDRNFRIS